MPNAIPDDDMPDWVRRAKEQMRRMNLYGLPPLSAVPDPEPEPDEPLPDVTDDQMRCVICGCFVLDPGAETCLSHRKFEHLKLLVLTGDVTDWAEDIDWNRGRPKLRHIQGMYSPCLVHWLASLRSVVAFVNGLHGTTYRFY